MKQKTITTGTAKYGTIRGISDAAVRKALAHGHATPGVKSAKKVGKTWLLTIDVQQLSHLTGVTEKNLVKQLGDN